MGEEGYQAWVEEAKVYGGVRTVNERGEEVWMMRAGAY